MNEETARPVDIILDPIRVRAWRGKREVSLTVSEFAIVLALAREPHREFRREELALLVRSRGPTQDIRAIDVHIGRIRKKMKYRARPDVIQTLNRRGYKFNTTGQIIGS